MTRRLSIRVDSSKSNVLVKTSLVAAKLDPAATSTDCCAGGNQFSRQSSGWRTFLSCCDVFWRQALSLQKWLLWTQSDIQTEDQSKDYRYWVTFNISYCGTLTEHRGFMISAQMAVHYIFAPPLLRRNRFSGPPDAYNTGAEGGRRGLRWDLPEYFTLALTTYPQS